LLAAVADATVSLLGNDISWKQVKNSIWTICIIDLLLKESIYYASGALEEIHSNLV
jgi:hypothetical protein